MLFFLLGTTRPNLVALFHLIVLCLLLSFLTRGWSLLGDKPTRLLMLLQEKSRYELAPLFILIYLIVLKLLLSMKCYKHVSLNKKKGGSRSNLKNESEKRRNQRIVRGIASIFKTFEEKLLQIQNDYRELKRNVKKK